MKKEYNYNQQLVLFKVIEMQWIDKTNNCKLKLVIWIILAIKIKKS